MYVSDWIACAYNGPTVEYAFESIVKLRTLVIPLMWATFIQRVSGNIWVRGVYSFVRNDPLEIPLLCRGLVLCRTQNIFIFITDKTVIHFFICSSKKSSMMETSEYHRKLRIERESFEAEHLKTVETSSIGSKNLTSMSCWIYILKKLGHSNLIVH